MAAHVERDEEHEEERVLRELVRQNAQKSSAATAISNHVENLLGG